jgi:TrmH family RNA methyltransferase
MSTAMTWKRYRKEDAFSYSLGAFPTLELINKRKDLVLEILISPAYREKEALIQRLEAEGIPYRVSDKQLKRLATKGNIYLAGVFKKSQEPLAAGAHVVLDQVQDMGNLGNICRTLLGMGLHDLVLLGQGCDFYDPRTVRASMGALFSIRMAHFDSLEAYLARYGQGRTLYAFMLDPTAQSLPAIQPQAPWSLVFGNEGSGLDPDLYRGRAQAVMIPQSEEVDSLNLTTACAIGLYHFTKEQG